MSDYASSGVGGFALDGAGSLAFGAQLSTDPALATSKGRAFFIDRYGGNLFELDPVCGGLLAGRAPFSTDDPTSHLGNPQDVGVAGDGTLWVPRYDAPSVLLLSPSGAQRQSIDLSSYDDDGNPEASAIDLVTVNGAEKAFVTLERLKYDATLERPVPQPGVPSQVLRLDVASAAPEIAVSLLGSNPFQVDDADDGAMWLAEPGDFFTANETAAGVERFDPQTSTSRLVVREADLGGSVSEVAVATVTDCAAAIVADASSANRTSLATFVPSTGAIVAPASAPVLGPTGGFDLQGVLWVGGVLLVGDRGTRADGKYAVHAFDRGAGCALVARPDLILLPQKPVALRASAAASGAP